jgi:hypothetical protein
MTQGSDLLHHRLHTLGAHPAVSWAVVGAVYGEVNEALSWAVVEAVDEAVYEAVGWAVYEAVDRAVGEMVGKDLPRA